MDEFYCGCDDFYLTLPSSVDYPGNSANSFNCPLAHPLQLKGRWECGLVSTHYPTTLQFFDRLWVEYEISGVAHRFQMPKGEYTSLQQLLSVFSKSCIWPLSQTKFGPELSKKTLKEGHEVATWNSMSIYPPEGEHPVVLLSNEPVPISKVSFSPSLANILGFPHVYTVRQGYPLQVIGSPLRLDAFQDTPHLMYIYCNAVEDQFVGDRKVPLLRIVHPSPTRHADFPNIHYLPVLFGSLTSVEINVRTDTGAFFPFADGKSVFKIHMRKKR